MRGTHLGSLVSHTAPGICSTAATSVGAQARGAGAECFFWEKMMLEKKAGVPRTRGRDSGTTTGRGIRRLSSRTSLVSWNVWTTIGMPGSMLPASPLPRITVGGASKAPRDSLNSLLLPDSRCHLRHLYSRLLAWWSMQSVPPRPRAHTTACCPGQTSSWSLLAWPAPAWARTPYSKPRR